MAPDPAERARPRASASALLARGTARIVDGVIVGVAAGVVVAGLSVEPTTPAALGLIALVHLAYFVVLEGRRGASLGKRMAGLEVHVEGGGPPGPVAALKRNLWLLLLPFGLLGVTFVPIAIAVTIYVGGGRGVHDLWAGTVVEPAA